MTGWNPWRALRSRPHLRLQWAEMHPAKGRIVDMANGIRIVTLDPRLDRRERRTTLAHELVHDEYDLLWPAGTPSEIVAKGEFHVERETMDRLIPLVELNAFVEARRDVEPIEAVHVADEFDVPEDLAGRALARLRAVTF